MTKYLLALVICATIQAWRVFIEDKSIELAWYGIGYQTMGIATVFFMQILYEGFSRRKAQP